MLSENLKKIARNLNSMDPKSVAKELRIIASKIEAQAADVEEDETQELKDYKLLLTKLKNKESINKLKIFVDNSRIRKPILWWLTSIDKGEGAGAIDFIDLWKKIKFIITRDLPAANFLKMILDYGVANGYIALDRILGKGRAKVTLMKDNK